MLKQQVCSIYSLDQYIETILAGTDTMFTKHHCDIGNLYNYLKDTEH
jgi:hypothetical protein